MYLSFSRWGVNFMEFLSVHNFACFLFQHGLIFVGSYIFISLYTSTLLSLTSILAVDDSHCNGKTISTAKEEDNEKMTIHVSTITLLSRAGFCMVSLTTLQTWNNVGLVPLMSIFHQITWSHCCCANNCTCTKSHNNCDFFLHI